VYLEEVDAAMGCAEVLERAPARCDPMAGTARWLAGAGAGAGTAHGEGRAARGAGAGAGRRGRGGLAGCLRLGLPGRPKSAKCPTRALCRAPDQEALGNPRSGRQQKKILNA